MPLLVCNLRNGHLVLKTVASSAASQSTMVIAASTSAAGFFLRRKTEAAKRAIQIPLCALAWKRSRPCRLPGTARDRLFMARAVMGDNRDALTCFFLPIRECVAWPPIRQGPAFGRPSERLSKEPSRHSSIASCPFSCDGHLMSPLRQQSDGHRLVRLTVFDEKDLPGWQ